MNKQKSARHPIDDLLKQTMKDDLPPEVENRLHVYFRRFQEKTDEQGKLNLNVDEWARNFFNRSDPDWRLGRLLIKNAALVFAFIVFVILLVTAGFVPLTGSRSVLAESYSVLATSLNVSEQISRSNGMECSGEVVTGKGKPLTYSLKWTPDWTQVLVISPDNIILKTFQIKNDQITIIDRTDNTLRQVEGLEHVDDPQFQPIRDFISPARLQQLLQMRWKPGISRQRGECDEGTFTVLNSQARADMEITVDMCTFLPSQVIIHRPIPAPPGKEGDIVMRIHFSWETPPYLPRLMEPKNTVIKK